MTLRLLNALLIALVIGILVPGQVLGHSDLEESDPAEGDTITTPYTLTARFSDEFDPDRSFIRVHDSSGARVALGEVSEDDPLVMIVELPELAPGEYEVRWQTVTPDDNGVENDTFRFTVQDPPSPPATPPSPSASVPSPTASDAVPTLSPTTSPLSTASPALAPTPSATAAPVDGSPSGTGTDLVLALVLAAVAIGAVLLFIFARNRR